MRIGFNYCSRCLDDAVAVVLDGSADGLPLCYNCYCEYRAEDE